MVSNSQHIMFMPQRSWSISVLLVHQNALTSAYHGWDGAWERFLHDTPEKHMLLPGWYEEDSFFWKSVCNRFKIWCLRPDDF